MTFGPCEDVMGRMARRLELLYGPVAGAAARRRLEMMIGRYGLIPAPGGPSAPAWDAAAALLIVYGDSVQAPARRPLEALGTFLADRFAGAFSHVHVLPFFPSSSDDGFSVVHFRNVDPALGTWADIRALADRFGLAADLVLNHVSRSSGWFQDYLTGTAPGRHYIIEADPALDWSAVARPRTHPLLTKVMTRAGERHVWTTFSEDQVDLNYAQPDLLFEMLDILLYYISMGATVIRLDAIAYLWKEHGTPCLHHPKTHEIVKLMRDLLRVTAPGTVLLTETNVPHAENVSYFGGGDEAHWVYNFALPPLLLHATATGDASTLTRWAASLEAPSAGCAFLNFTASHDGIGVRPLEGWLPPAELDRLVAHTEAVGGQVSKRRMPDGSESPYELNTTWYAAMGGPGVDPALQEARHLCSQTVPLSLRGVPALYLNSLLAADNDMDLMKLTGRARSLNRTKWQAADLDRRLSEDGAPRRVFEELRRRLRIRAAHPAFHPDAPQVVHELHPSVFAVERRSGDGGERVLCLHNLGSAPVAIDGRSLAAVAPNGVDLLRHDAPVRPAEGLSLDPCVSLWIRASE